MSDFAFISPIPGRPSSRVSRSGPSAASRPDAPGIVVVVVGDRGGERLDLAGHRAREAVQRRALAEDRRRARVGSIAAIRAASRCPIRRFSSAGPLNAFWTVTCWSSAKPMSRASGSSTSSRSASASPVNGSDRWSRSWTGMVSGRVADTSAKPRPLEAAMRCGPMAGAQLAAAPLVGGQRQVTDDRAPVLAGARRIEVDLEPDVRDDEN